MEIRTLTAKHGLLWIKNTFLIFIKKPSFFIAAALLYILIKHGMPFLTADLPSWLSRLLNTLIRVYLAAAVMVGCALISSPNHLQRAYFKAHPFPRAWGMILKNKNILILALIVSTISAFRVYGITQIPTEAVVNLSNGIISQALILVAMYALTSSILWAITTALFSMTPTIIFCHSVSPIKAIFYNARAFFKNWKAWVCWALVIQLLLCILYVPIIFFMVKYFDPLNKPMTLYFAFLSKTLPIFLMVFTATCHYFAYKDSFLFQQQPTS